MATIAASRVKGYRMAVAVGATLLLALAALALDASPAFAADPTLTVSRAGGGTVTSNPAGIDCGSDCTETFAVTYTEDCHFDEEIRQVVCEDVPVYQDVTLTASTPSGWSFAGWGGECSGTATTCALTMDTDKSVSASWTDVQNPSVSLTSPSGPYVSGTISVQATASDNDRVSSVQFFVGSQSLGTDTTAPYSVSFNTVGSDGSRQFRAVATDASGRTAEASRTVTVDNTAPTLSVTGPNGETFGPGTTQTWNFTAGDVTSGVQNVQCKVEVSGSPSAFGACSGGNSSHSVSNLPGGTYTFSVRATDRAGNLSNLQTRTFSIDATAPATSITGGPSGTVNTSSARFSFSSEAGATFECKLDGAAFSACTSSKSYTALTNGRHTFSVRARDGAGNVDASPASRTWTVDTIKPTVVPISPRHASITRDTTPTIKATVKDNLTNLQKSNIKLYVSGTLVPTTRYSYSASTDVLTYNSPRLAKGKKTVKIVATDAARNVGMKSWYFTIR